jgi:RimJ/RimL family protein N-acetyltransferase
MIALEAMSRNESDREFAYQLKKEALGPYVAEKWGWNEGLQRQMHADRWPLRTFFRILRHGVPIGAVAFDEKDDHIQLEEFYIFRSQQRQGFGTEALQAILTQAKTRSLPVRLQCLKWNPAITLYRRNGFIVTHESEHHYLMESSGG